MGREKTVRILFGLVASLTWASAAPADITTGLVGYWPLDGDAQDASGNGHHGTVMGAVTFVADRHAHPASAAKFTGSTSVYINLGQPPALLIKGAMTVTAWVRADTLAQTGRIIAKQGPASGRSWGLNLETAGHARFDLGTTPTERVRADSAVLSFGPNDWFHLAGVFRPGKAVELYVNGILAQSQPTTVTEQWIENGLPINIGRRPEPGTPWRGDIDEARMYARALSSSDVMELIFGRPGLSGNPAPANEETDVPADAMLSWTAGEFAATHDVYLGTSFQDVSEASVANPLGVLARAGHDANTWHPGPLEFGRTYYWRVDEVNQAPDSTVYQGDVWSFTVEPYAYPIGNVTATASGSTADMGPENTVNGSGLNASDQHSTDPKQMWLSTNVPPNWIQFEFDQAYKLHELWVWNSNQLVEAFVGFGARDVAIEYSLDGATWTVLENVPQFARAAGAATYTHDTIVPFGGVIARYVKLTVDRSWGGQPQAGLSEVRFFHVPVQARRPQPAAGAKGVDLDAALNWRPGREAASHKIFFGTDEQAVANGAAAAQTVADHSFMPASLGFGTTYYWKVDEVGENRTYAGDVWSFTTREYAAVDDMESYNDDDNRIYESWIDGLTTKASGSQVGYDVSPFAERTIVHGGKQSMPFLYDNTNVPFYSEAEREFDSLENWTVSGADTLSLWVRGAPAAFVEDAGTITVSAAGHDIWDNADDFRFAYKTLNGDGSILVKVESLVNTNAWAKAGVMIRQSLDADAKFAYMIQSFSSGVSLGWRPQVAAACGSATQAGITAPQWVKLIRKGDVFTAQYSADSKTWTDLKNADGTVASTTVAMTNPVYIGLCVTSHNAAASTTAVMSGATTTGNVTGGSWQVQAIGDDPQPANAPADLYVTIQDSAGKTATATNPAAVTTAAWTQWKIPLSSFTGVNMSRVKKMYVGVGNKAAPVKGGTGIFYVDDIAFGRPASTE